MEKRLHWSDAQNLLFVIKEFDTRLKESDRDFLKTIQRMVDARMHISKKKEIRLHKLYQEVHNVRTTA